MPDPITDEQRQHALDPKAPLHERLSFALGLRPNREDGELVRAVLDLRAPVFVLCFKCGRDAEHGGFTAITSEGKVWCVPCSNAAKEHDEALKHERYMERCRAVVLMEGLVDCAGVDDCKEPQDCAAHRLAEVIHPDSKKAST